MTEVFRPRWSLLVDLAGLGAAFVALWIFQSLPKHESFAASHLFLTGTFLLAGLFAGHISGRIGIPRITGCIIFGALLSPSLSSALSGTPLAFHAVLSDAQAGSMKLVNNLAIGLIALMAGAEIRLAALRERLRAVLSISALQGLLVPIAIATALFGLTAVLHIPFIELARAEGKLALPVALLAGAILAANSPTVVVTILKETQARGPLATTVMGISVVMDAFIILAFTMLVAIIASTGAVETGRQANSLLWVGGEVLLGIIVSVAFGLVIGVLLRRYTERSDYRLGYTLVGIALVVASIGGAFGIEPLFCLLAAGFACENFGYERSLRSTHRLDDALRRVSQPVFIVFFVAVGLNMDLNALVESWYLVLILSFIRLVCVWSAVRIGSKSARAPDVVKRYGWIGMVSQAGVTLALSQLIATRFPSWGAALANLVVAMVALHELAAPVAFSWSLRRAGEIGHEGITG